MRLVALAFAGLLVVSAAWGTETGAAVRLALGAVSGLKIHAEPDPMTPVSEDEDGWCDCIN